MFNTLACVFILIEVYISNLGHDILELYNVLAQIRSTKRNAISIIGNLVYELPHELPNDLRLRVLVNKKILGKSQIWVETQPSTPSPSQKSKLWQQQSKTRESRYQTFLVLLSFTRFLYFVPNILSRIVVQFLYLIMEKNGGIFVLRVSVCLRRIIEEIV